MLRVYVPDDGTNLTGGVGLPKPTLKLADGTVLEGKALCDAVDSESKALGHTRVPDPGALLISADSYRAMRYPDMLSAPVDVFGGLMSVPRPVPPSFPAVPEGEWRAQYDRRYLLQLWTGDHAPGANPDPAAAQRLGRVLPECPQRLRPDGHQPSLRQGRGLPGQAADRAPRPCMATHGWAAARSATRAFA